jgi:hypothetical protein
MLRVCITAVSLLAVLAHVTLGCCLHHAHAAEPSPDQACSAGHHHHGESARPDHDGLPLPAHDDCHEAHCHLVPASQVSVPDHIDVAFDLVNLTSGDEMGRTVTAAAANEFLGDASHLLPLRAHLRYCVLLN